MNNDSRELGMIEEENFFEKKSFRLLFCLLVTRATRIPLAFLTPRTQKIDSSRS